MAKYRVIAASVNIHAGVLGLEPHQARARLHRLTPMGGNEYEIVDGPVTFKRGEMFDYEGDLPKDLAESIHEVVHVPIEPEPGPDDGVTAPSMESAPKRKKPGRAGKLAA